MASQCNPQRIFMTKITHAFQEKSEMYKYYTDTVVDDAAKISYGVRVRQ